MTSSARHAFEYGYLSVLKKINNRRRMTRLRPARRPIVATQIGQGRYFAYKLTALVGGGRRAIESSGAIMFALLRVAVLPRRAIGNLFSRQIRSILARARLLA